MHNYTIGYFGVPGKTGGKTHIVNVQRQAMCGSRFSPKSEYQWCYPTWQLGVPECNKCRDLQLAMFEANASSTKTNKATPVGIKLGASAPKFGMEYKRTKTAELDYDPNDGSLTIQQEGDYIALDKEEVETLRKFLEDIKTKK